MKPIIYLFKETILFIGQIPPNSRHAIPVDALSTNLTGSFSISGHDGQSIVLRTLFWPSGEPRQTQYEKEAVLAFLVFPSYLKIASLIANNMLSSLGTRGVRYELKQQQQWIDWLSCIYQQRPEAAKVKKDLTQLLCDHNDSDLFEMQPHMLDSRIVQAIALIKQQVLFDQEFDIAQLLGMSSQNLRRLFKQQVGNSMSQYRTHLRMFFAAQLRGQGRTLSESAIEAGFYDLSHVNRMHKKGYGISMADTISVSDIKVDAAVLDNDFPLNDLGMTSQASRTETIQVNYLKRI